MAAPYMTSIGANKVELCVVVFVRIPETVGWNKEKLVLWA
jgi:hypothetical protein